MAIGGVVVQFKADADKAIKTIDKVTRSLGRVEDGSVKANAKFSKMAKVGLGAVAAGGALAAVALFDFAKAAAADWQEARKLERALSRIPGVTDAMVESNAAWIDSMEIATTVADSDLRNAIATLALATGDLTQAQQLAALAVDVAVGRNLSLESVTRMLEKAYGGNTQALKRQMPWLDANRDGTLTYAEAVKGLTEAYGGAAEAAANNDPWKRIQAVWSQMKEALGSFVLPMLEELGTWFADKKNQDALQGWITKVGEFSRAIGEKLVAYIRDTFIPFVQDELIPAIEDVYAWFGSPEGKAFIKGWGDTLEDLGGVISPVVTNLDKLFTLLDKLPGNWVLQKLGLIPKFDFSGTPTSTSSYPRTLNKDQQTALSGERGGRDKPANRATVNVVINNGKQEPSVDSAALALRLTRTLMGAA